MDKIFVFGSNLKGIHGKGAALVARKEYGAVLGVGEGRTGNAYAIPTKETPAKTLPLDSIEASVARFRDYVKDNPHNHYLIASPGCGLAGYCENQIAPMFMGLHHYNVEFEVESWHRTAKFGPYRMMWARWGGYEVSSRGDKRFSAFNARLNGGRTIEEIYQCDIKGYDIGGTNWKLGKGKPGLIHDEDLQHSLYVDLWRQWGVQNKPLMRELWVAAMKKNMVLSDMFATTRTNQANALSIVLNEFCGY